MPLQEQELTAFATTAEINAYTERNLGLITAGMRLNLINEEIAKLFKDHSQFQAYVPMAVFAAAVQDLWRLVALWIVPENQVNGSWKRAGYWDQVNNACLTAQEKAGVGEDHANLAKVFSKAQLNLAEVEETVNALQIEAFTRNRIRKAYELPPPALTGSRQRARP